MNVIVNFIGSRAAKLRQCPMQKVMKKMTVKVHKPPFAKEGSEVCLIQSKECYKNFMLSVFRGSLPSL